VADLALRLVLILAVIGVAALVAFITRRGVSHHPALSLASTEFEPGLVVFTSTDCRRCKEMLMVAKATGAPLREVTYELEPALQERVGVTGVPLTLVIASDGRPSAQFAGLVKPSRLRRALVRAGI
jgi:thioredoxin-like negative regulator of GroEL